MSVTPGGGSVSQTIRLEDSISQQYGVADGTNFCGERSYEVFDTREWISFDGTTLTLTSEDENDQPELVFPTLQMTLEGNTEPTCSIQFRAEVGCPMCVPDRTYVDREPDYIRPTEPECS